MFWNCTKRRWAVENCHGFPLEGFTICSILRGLMSAAIVLGLIAQSHGQTMVSPAFSKDKPQAAEAKPEPKVIKIYAAAEPDPALRYRFWPAHELRRQGNPMPFISRAILLSVQANQGPNVQQEFIQKYEQFSEASLDELPADEVREFLQKYGGAALRELARAENLFDLDYDLRLDEMSASELIETVLPEIQESRALARLLYLRARLAIAQQRWDDFVHDVRLGFRLAECTGRGNDFLIGRLVCYAICGVMMNAVEEAIQQPGCPNLYWALASMPETRLSEIRDSLEFETVLLARLFRDVRTLPDTEIGEQAARIKLLDLVEEAGQLFGSFHGMDVEATAQMIAGFYVVTMADPSREMLAATDAWGDKAYALSSSEAVLRAMQLKFDRIRDSWAKWSLLPPEMWRDYKDEAEMNLKLDNRTDVIEIMVSHLAPASDAARRASRRMVQNRNMLLTIEAIRMHAAVHGQLPESIDKLRPVPAWTDGLAFKPFGYTRTSPSTATFLQEPRYGRDQESTMQIQLLK